MERPKTVDIVTDAAMVLVLVALGVFAAVAPAVVIAIGIPATIGYRLITRSRTSKPHFTAPSAGIDRVTARADVKAFGQEVHAA